MAPWHRVWSCVLLAYLCCQGFLSEPDSCLPGEFANSTGPAPIGCLPCSSCGEGEGIVEHCHTTSDTQCQPCREESYSDVTPLGRQCQNCTECSPSRLEASPCSLDEDTVCGPCAPAYFLYIDSNGAKCKECSQCPEDRVAIHWIECAEAGLPQDHQCAPGEVPTDPTTPSTTTVATSTITEPPPTSEDTSPFSLSTDRGGFISQPEAELITVETPAEAVGIAITIISILFTILTLVVFISAFGRPSWRLLKKCLSVEGRCCTCAKQSVAESSSDSLELLETRESDYTDGGESATEV